MKKVLLFLSSLLLIPFTFSCGEKSNKEWTVTFIHNCEIEGKSETQVKVKDGEKVSPLDIKDKNPDKTLEFKYWYPEEGSSFQYDFSSPVKCDFKLYAKWELTNYYKFINKLKENEEKGIIENGKAKIKYTYKDEEPKTIGHQQIDKYGCIKINDNDFCVKYTPQNFPEIWKNCTNVSYATNAVYTQIYCDTYLDDEPCKLDLKIYSNNYVLSIEITKNNEPYFKVNYGDITYLTAVMHTVTFVHNCEIEGQNETVVSVRDGLCVDELDIKNKNPDKTLEFKYWSPYQSLSSEFDFTTPITYNITLYAKWEVKPYYQFLNKMKDNESSTISYTKVSSLKYTYKNGEEKTLTDLDIDKYKCVKISNTDLEVKYTVNDFKTVWTNCSNFIYIEDDNTFTGSCNAISEGMSCHMTITLDNDNYLKGIVITQNNSTYFKIKTGDITYE